MDPRAFVISTSQLNRPVVTKSFVRPIKLLYYHEYEPADSDSSGEESVDDETDSEDEWAIDDAESLESIDGGESLEGTNLMLEALVATSAEVSEAVDPTTVNESDTLTASGKLKVASIDETA